MSDDPRKSIFVSCPTCRVTFSVDLSDRAAVRRIGSEKGRPFVIAPLLVQVQCRACGRLIMQTVTS